MNQATYVQQACDILDNKGLCGKVFFRYLEENNMTASVVSYKNGAVVFSRENYQKALAVICRGQLLSSKKVGGNELLLRTMKPGDVFGIAGLFGDDTPYVSEIVAKTDSVLVLFSEDLLKKIFLYDPYCSIAYIKFLSAKVRYLSMRLDDFVTPNAYGKLALYLFENNGFCGSMSTLAKTLGFSRMTLYRNLDLLISEGFIKKNGKCIEITDPNVRPSLESPDEIL